MANNIRTVIINNVSCIPLPSQPPGAANMASSEPPPILSSGEEPAAPQDEMPSDETDLNKLEETEAAVMSLLASEADNDEAIDQGQSLLNVSEPYSGAGDSEEFPVKESSSRTSPQDSESGLADGASGEATVKLTSEGLSSLVSYSSSSAEVSASEDNAQDDPENSSLDEVAARGEGAVQYIEAAESGSEKVPEEVQQESSQVSPGEVLAAAADALADTADIDQVHVEEAAAVDSMAAALAEASSNMALSTDLTSMDVNESGIPEVVPSDQEEKAGVQSSVLAEESNATVTHLTKEEEGITKGCAEESKGSYTTFFILLCKDVLMCYVGMY